VAAASNNPFTASFGVPSGDTYVGRDAELAEFRQGLADRPGSTYRAIMVSGPRGMGKTTLVSVMAEHAMAEGWIAASVTAGPGVAERILDKATLAAEHLLPPAQHRVLTGLSVAGFTLQSQVLPSDTPSWWRRTTTLLNILDQHGSGLVVAIDEVHRAEAELRPLFQQYQELVNDRRNVALVMAGLPGAVEGVLSEHALTFVQRAHRQNLGPINQQSIAAAYREAVAESGKRIDGPASSLAAALSEGYPYMYQLIGYFAWQAAGDSPTISDQHVRSALGPARDLAGRNLYEVELRSLSRREHEFLGAMLADDDSSAVSDIARRLGTTANNANYYRGRLAARGLIQPSGRGTVRFASSYLRAYLERNQPSARRPSPEPPADA
jgi:hypothetical protein